MKKQLNHKGKVLSVFLLAAVVLLAIGLMLPSAKKESADAGQAASLAPLAVSFDPLADFGESPFRQSIVVKERQERETARKEAVAKQNTADVKEKAIYLTFDDGPSKESGKLLDLLDARQMKATFFMLGPNIEAHPEPVKRMENEGFGLALHGITHEARQVYSSRTAPAQEMSQDRDIVEKITGVRTNLVRLPYGSIPYLTEEMRDELDRTDFRVWDWNVDSRDWELKDERYVQHTIQAIQRMSQAGVTPVVLLHDKPATIEHLPKLLEFIRKQGYRTKVLTNEMPPVTFQCEGRCSGGE
ncbi:hypothetical protein NCCP2716_29720 [Sporosarcina sp. NCCP-2716]|uniref:polysaccharide deacetylase family protein n=1 Tax=Sporosarcina sp. NCCP-2716 TaxID=2943679 RepID=UPI00203F0E49|nr:polysaccharide deacetylase family protein [Sporosarcina sp. NCCP-2716]GKV70474.1 hypothetical protein NCCP2716_29720 [Sporosarcina sp. NCCP-2716]